MLGFIERQGFDVKRLSTSLAMPLVSSRSSKIGVNLTDVGANRPNFHDVFPKAYEGSVWVYTCVWAIASNIAGLKIRLFVPNKDDPTEETEVEFPILERPNPFTSGEELLESLVTSLELTGNAYWEKVMGFRGMGMSGSEVSNLFWIMSNMIEVVPDAQRFISGYKVKMGEKTVRYETDEIAHFKYHNPNDYYYGLSPVRAAMTAIETEGHGRRLLKQMYKNGAIPGGVLSSEEQLSDEVLKRLKKEWTDSYKTENKAFTPAVLEQGLKFSQIQLSPMDLAFIQFAELSRTEILAVFGVPPILVGLETQNFATAKEQRRVFYESTLMPKTRKIAAVIQNQVVQDIPGVKVRFDFSSIPELQRDWVSIASVVIALKESNLISLNESREILTDLMPVKDFPGLDGIGDFIYGDMADVALGMVVRPDTTKILRQTLASVAEKITRDAPKGGKDAKLKEKFQTLVAMLTGVGADTELVSNNEEESLWKRLKDSGLVDRLAKGRS